MTYEKYAVMCHMGGKKVRGWLFDDFESAERKWQTMQSEEVFQYCASIIVDVHGKQRKYYGSNCEVELGELFADWWMKCVPQTEEEDLFLKKTDRVVKRFSIARALVAVPIAILGVMCAGLLSDAPYYAQVPVSETQNWWPYCMAIVYKHSLAGVNIDFGTYGSGEELSSLGEFQSPVVTVERLQQQWPSVAVSDAKTIVDDECQLMIPRVGDKYLLLTGETGGQVPLRGFCGGEEPGLWIEGGSEEGGKGVAVLSMQGCILIWFVLRLYAMAIDFATTSGMNTESSFGAKYAFDFCIYAFFTVGCSILLAPIQNLEASELCPQLVTTYYSARTIVPIFWSGIVLIAYVTIIGLASKGDASHSSDGWISPFQGLGTWLCHTVWSNAYSFAFFSPMMVICAGCICWKVYLMLHMSIYEIFFFNIDLALRWWQLDLSAQANVFQLLTSTLLVLDQLNTHKKLWIEFRKRRRFPKARKPETFDFVMTQEKREARNKADPKADPRLLGNKNASGAYYTGKDGKHNPDQGRGNAFEDYHTGAGWVADIKPKFPEPLDD